MSSATKADPSAVQGLVRALPAGGSGPTNNLTPRQQSLDMLWRYFRCSNYEGWKHDWNGVDAVNEIDRDAIATSQVIPPGFYDAGGQTGKVPLKFRRPSAPYYLVRVIVNRFTSLLFSARRHPKVGCDDPLTEDWLAGFCEATRLWAQMIQCRNYGGGMGTAVVGFKFVKGSPVVEVHDPRWCFPEFLDRSTHELGSIEIRYQFPDQVRMPDGTYEEAWYWYRRVIDEVTDEIWPKVIADPDVPEPNWLRERSLKTHHGFGFCPAQWIQNQPVTDDIDGDPDAHGVYDLVDRIACQLSSADRAGLANCDPTPVISSDAEFAEINRGHGTALQVEKGGSVELLEMSGNGIDKSLAIADKLEERALTVARCMLDRNEGGPARTEEEVDHQYSSMLEQADVLREQYGENGVKKLLQMVLRAARALADARPVTDSTGVTRLQKQVVRLPKKRVVDEDTGDVTWVERELGTGEQIDLTWPEYFTPSPDAVVQKVSAAGQAKVFGLIDARHASKFVADDFQVEDIPAMVKKIGAEQAAQAKLQVGQGGGGQDSMASKVVQRTEAGAKTALPNPTARLLPRRF